MPFLVDLYNPGESAPCLESFPKILPLDQSNCFWSVLQTVVGAVEIGWSSPLPEVKEKIKDNTAWKKEFSSDENLWKG